MKPVDIEQAAAEAQRFIQTLNAWYAAEKRIEDAYRVAKETSPAKDYIYRGSANVEHAALKRASMDLTRALARMRRREG